MEHTNTHFGSRAKKTETTQFPYKHEHYAKFQAAINKKYGYYMVLLTTSDLHDSYFSISVSHFRLTVNGHKPYRWVVTY